MNQAQLEAYLDKIFDFVTERVWAEGGDGDATVVFKVTSVRKAADYFEHYLARRSNWCKSLPYKRIERSPEDILFTDSSNENFIFVSRATREGARADWDHELYLETW